MNEHDLEKKFIENDRGKIYYFVSADAKTPVSVIFLHGLSSNHTTWKDVIIKLRKNNIGSLALDMRGHGFSDKSRKRKNYRINVFAEDLERVVAEEKLDNFILLGYSFSGAVILEYFKKHPDKVKGIIFISANFTSPLKYKGIFWLFPLFYTVFNTLGWLLIWQKRKNYYYFEQGKAKGYWDSTLKGFGTMPLSINYWMLSEMTKINYTPVIEEIGCPALVIRSASDIFFSKKEMDAMAQKIKNCQCINLEETSHYLATAHQDKIKDLIVDFIKQI